LKKTLLVFDCPNLALRYEAIKKMPGDILNESKKPYLIFKKCKCKSKKKNWFLKKWEIQRKKQCQAKPTYSIGKKFLNDLSNTN
jgi:hypothetical protein